MKNAKILGIILLFLAISFFYSFEAITNINSQAIGKENKNQSEAVNSENTNLEKAPFFEHNDNMPDIMVPVGFDWKQFKGTTLNILCDNRIYANVLSIECEQFKKITGININIQNVDYNTSSQRSTLDFISKTGKYQLVFVDPYKTLTRFSKNLADLKQFNNDTKLPHIPGGIADFLQPNLEIESYFSDKEKLYSIPFDSNAMILYYRKDIFDKYREKFVAENGYDFIPGTNSFTWERYFNVAKWLTNNVSNKEVEYGTGHNANQDSGLFYDFYSVLAAYGGVSYSDTSLNSIGSKAKGKLVIHHGNFVEALKVYKKIINVSHPSSCSWNEYDLADAFKTGEIAMMPNWNFLASSLEDSTKSKVAGKVGYSILPTGPFGNANTFGGTGLGINIDSLEQEQKAAWLFIVWATSPQIELMLLEHPECGIMPSRKSVYSQLNLEKNRIWYNTDVEKIPSKDALTCQF